MESNDFEKNGDEVEALEATTVDDEKQIFVCDKCDREYKTQGPYEWHIKNCTGPKEKRVPMTDEEKEARHVERLRIYSEETQGVGFRLRKDSDDMAFIEAQIEALQETDEKAGVSTYLRTLLAKDKKNAIKRGDWEKVEEA